MKANISCGFRGFLPLSSILFGLMMSGGAFAATITHTDSYGIVYTLSTDGLNYGNAEYDVTVHADTTGFSADHSGTHFTFANTYFNALTIQAAGGADPLATSFTTGPGATGWTTWLGGQNQGGCNGNGADSGAVCAYSSPGGTNPITGLGVLMNVNGNGLLDWVFHLKFTPGTTLDQAFGDSSLAAFASHLKADYYGYQIKKVKGKNQSVYDFVGQISDDVYINNPNCTGDDCGDLPPPLPEPSILALIGLGMLGMAISYAHKRKFS